MFVTALTCIGLLLPSTIISDYSEATQNPISTLSENPTVYEVKQAISYVAKKYLIDESEFMQTIKCESEFNVKAVGDSGKAYGPAQFHKPTFNQYCKGDYYSAKDQLICMAEMWAKNPLNKFHWSCWKNYFTH